MPKDPRGFVTFRDSKTGLQYIRSTREIWEHGLAISLGAYESHVFWEFREVMDGVAGQWARLASRLDGAGVPSLDDAMREIQLEPLHVPFRSLFADGLTIAVMDGVATRPQFDELERRFAAFLEAVAAATGVDGDPAALASEIRDRTERAFVGMLPSAADAAAAEDAADAASDADAKAKAKTARDGKAADTSESVADADEAEVDVEHGLDRDERATLLAWLALSRAGALAPGADVAATSLAWYDELRLPGALVAGLHDAGFGEGDAWTVTDRVRVLLALPRPSTMEGLRGQPTRGCWTRGWPARTSGSPSASIPGRASNTSIGTGSRTWSTGRPVWMPSIRDRRCARRRPPAPTFGPGCPPPRKRPAIASIACGRPSRPEPRRSAARAEPDAPYPRRIRRRSDVGGVPWARTDSRCGR